MIEKFKYWDEQLFLYLNSQHMDWLDPIMNMLTEKLFWVPLYAFFLFLIIKHFKKGSIWIVAGVGLAILIADQSTSGFMKPFFERLRPCRQEGVMEFARMVDDYCGRYGYFSAHAASSTALAIYIGLILKDVYRKIIYFMIGWAIVVSYSRIYLGVHYPGDVITGIFIGIFFGWIFYKLQHFLIRKYTDIDISEKEVF